MKGRAVERRIRMKTVGWLGGEVGTAVWEFDPPTHYQIVLGDPLPPSPFGRIAGPVPVTDFEFLDTIEEEVKVNVEPKEKYEKSCSKK